MPRVSAHNFRKNSLLLISAHNSDRSWILSFLQKLELRSDSFVVVRPTDYFLSHFSSFHRQHSFPSSCRPYLKPRPHLLLCLRRCHLSSILVDTDSHRQSCHVKRIL